MLVLCVLDVVSLSHKHFTRSTIINSIIWDASRQVYMTHTFKSFFVMKYSQWLNAHSLMPQTVKSPVTYPVQKPLDNIHTDNTARARHNDKKICDFIYWGQTTHSKAHHSLSGLKSVLASSSGFSVESVRSEWEHLEKTTTVWLGASSPSHRGSGREHSLVTSRLALRQHHWLVAACWIRATTEEDIALCLASYFSLCARKSSLWFKGLPWFRWDL